MDGEGREGGKKDRQKGPSRVARNGGEGRKERCGGRTVGLESEGRRRERVGQFPCREGQRGGRGCWDTGVDIMIQEGWRKLKRGES